VTRLNDVLLPVLHRSVAAGPTRPAAVDRRGAVRVEGASKVYGDAGSAVPALDHLDLDVAPGSFVCVLGASGCGKSTLLNLVAGLDRPSAGRISVEGRTSLMFQDAALYPWLTAARAVELPLRLDGMGRDARRARVRELLELVHLGDFAGKRPHELSGGMRQRVALARALGQRTDVLLMDEPFGALDAMTRDTLHDEVERIWQQSGISVLFVTHNVREAVRLGDRVVLLSSRPGRVIAEFPVAIDRPRRIDSPAVATLAATITDQLRAEVSRHGDH
jgi:NitT/TauT family transport system ATP-binding protein